MMKKVLTEQLPFDFRPFVSGDGSQQISSNPNIADSKTVPWVAYNHLAKYGISHECMSKFNIGWSPSWHRIIFPLYEYTTVSDKKKRKYWGWVGRDPSWDGKDPSNPKWMSRTNREKRRYYNCPGIENKVVLVEDAISATRVWSATKYTTIALLNTFVCNDLSRTLRGKTIYLWLDGDQLAHSVATVSRMRELGLDARRIHTPKDPKDYNEFAIQTTLKNERETNNFLMDKEEPDYAG
jgi:hypothetical protein